MRMTQWLTRLAAAAWLFLALLTAASGLAMRMAQAINLVVAALFLGIAVLLWLRMRAVERVGAALGPADAMRALLLTETISSAVMLFAGASFLYAAAHRVLVEGFAVFG